MNSLDNICPLRIHTILDPDSTPWNIIVLKPNNLLAISLRQARS